MLSLFRKRQNTMLGVDIDSLSLSLLELTSEGDTFRVEAYAREVLPQSGQITKNTKTEDTVDIEAQSQCLEQMIKKGKFSTKKAVSAVSSSNIITKQLIMDGSLNDEEIENQIILEAERIIPYSIEEVSIDFDVLGKNENDDTKINVLLVACRRQIVDERESLLNLAGLKPQIIDVTTYAMERAYPLIASQLQLKKADSRVALVHIGDLFITLNVLQNGDSIYVGSYPFGGKHCVERLSEGKYSLSEALKYYVQQELPKSCDQQILATFHSQCAGHINRLLEQFYNTKHLSVDHVVLSGGMIAMDLLEKQTESLANIPCCIANPCSSMRLSSSVDKQQINQMAPALYVACGLAMRTV